MTVAVLHALAIAERGGLEVEPDAFAGALRWIDRMTDPEFGQVGYNMPGGSPARPEGLQEAFPAEKSQSMTAMGVLARILVGEDPGTEMNRKGTELCLEQLPNWRSDGSIDMYFWYYGTLALHAGQGKADKRWYARLTSALLPNQRTESVFAGSWDPVGPWGNDGGRVYSTAISALSPATPFRLSASFAARKPTGVYASAAKALRKSAKSGDPRIRSRAALWVRQAGG